MTSKQTDERDRRYRQQSLDEALEQDRRGRGRLRDMADKPAPDRDDQHLGTPNRHLGDRP